MARKKRQSNSKERTLLLAAIIPLIIAFVAVSNNTVMSLVHGLTQLIYAGNSLGKTIIALAWFVFTPLFSLALVKTRLARFLEGKKLERVLGIGFIAFTFSGYALGAIQVAYMQGVFDTGMPMATMVKEGEYTGWEASLLWHNHFPKTTVYFAKSLLPFATPSLMIDDGYPLYTITPYAWLWSSAYLLLLGLALACGLGYLNSRLKKTKTIDYTLFSAGLLGTTITLVDGGIAAGTTFLAAYFLLLYYARTYLKKRGPAKKAFFPFVMLAIGMLAWFYGIKMNVYSYPIMLALMLSTGHYLYEKNKGKKWKTKPNAGNIALAAVFLLCLAGSVFVYSFHAFGQKVSEEKNLLVYGLPEDKETEYTQSLEGFGEVKEAQKRGWLGTARIKPGKSLYSNALEKELKKSLKPEGYLYVEVFDTEKRIELVKVHWFDYKGSKEEKEELLENPFKDLNVLRVVHSREENASFAVVESVFPEQWMLLLMLSEAREKGYKGRLLASIKTEKQPENTRFERSLPSYLEKTFR